MNSENKLIIEQLNKFGRVPQTYELLQMIEQMEQENKKLNGAIQSYDILLKANVEENKQLKDKTEDYKRMKDNFDSKVDVLTKIEIQQKKFVKYLEDEKDRLARECSNIYEDSLGHTRLVNEDIFDEVNDILQKYKSIIGGKE